MQSPRILKDPIINNQKDELNETKSAKCIKIKGISSDLKLGEKSIKSGDDGLGRINRSDLVVEIEANMSQAKNLNDSINFGGVIFYFKECQRKSTNLSMNVLF